MKNSSKETGDVATDILVKWNMIMEEKTAQWTMQMPVNHTATLCTAATITAQAFSSSCFWTLHNSKMQAGAM